MLREYNKNEEWPIDGYWCGVTRTSPGKSGRLYRLEPRKPLELDPAALDFNLLCSVGQCRLRARVREGDRPSAYPREGNARVASRATSSEVCTCASVLYPCSQCVPPFWDFPYPSAGRFRERLLRRRADDPDLHRSGEFADLLASRLLSLVNNPVEERPAFLDPDIVPESYDPNSSTSVLGEDDGSCHMQGALRGKAKALVRHIRVELGLKPIRDLPDRIVCGELRSAIRSIYPASLPEDVELSLKTTQKCEVSCCDVCKPQFTSRIESWKSQRFQPQHVDAEHLSRFIKAFRSNVPKGWDSRRVPFIPNGSASLYSRRRRRGNWNLEPFSPVCRPELVFSSGKPRVVTLYSSYNTRVLTPLHHSLYSFLRRKGWLVDRDVSPGLVAGLNGGGDFLSFDYVGATDNLKSAYVRAAIEVLVDQASYLTDSEIRCLRVLGELRFTEDGPVCESGQPMGSVMSFPLLCLFNKTVVDLALSDLLESGEISFSEWMSHRCLINGDDLLLREPRHDSRLYYLICDHGAACGFVVNREKSMSSGTKAEMNSTLFRQVDGDTRLEKKSNLSALYMKPEIEDVLGFAAQATRSKEGFKRVVRANARFLARQDDKGLYRLPYYLQEICRKDRKIRRAILSRPIGTRVDPATNFLPVEVKPWGYDLSRDEELRVIEDEVDRVRPRVLDIPVPRKNHPRRGVVPAGVSWRSRLRRPRTMAEEDLILRCLVDHWKGKKRDSLVEDSGLTTEYAGELPPSDLPNMASRLVDAIRGWKAQGGQCATSKLATTYVVEDIGDYIPLD